MTMRLLIAVLALGWTTGLAQAQGRSKIAPPEPPRQGEQPDGVVGFLKALDPKKGTFILETEKGVMRMLTAANHVRVIGQRDGRSKDGLEDKRLGRGAKLLAVQDGGRVTELHILEPVMIDDLRPETDSRAAPEFKTAVKPDIIDGPRGKIVEIDRDASRFTIEAKDRRQVFTFDRQTKFYGPDRLLSTAKAADDRFRVGAVVTVVTQGPSPLATEVHLPDASEIKK